MPINLTPKPYAEFTVTDTPVEALSTGKLRMYAKSDGLFYKQDPILGETLVDSNSGGNAHLIVTDTINPTVNKLIDSILIINIRSMDYIVELSTPTKSSSFKIMVTNKGTETSHSIYGVLGQDMLFDIDISNDSTSVNFHMQNNESEVITVVYMRHTI